MRVEEVHRSGDTARGRDGGGASTFLRDGDRRKGRTFRGRDRRGLDVSLVAVEIVVPAKTGLFPTTHAKTDVRSLLSSPSVFRWTT